MNATTEEERILATDTKGRVRLSPERRNALLEEFDRSGMTAARFATWAGIKYQTLAGWIMRRRRASKASVSQGANAVSEPQKSPRWVEAVLEQPDSGIGGRASLVVHFPGHVLMEVTDARSAPIAVEIMRQWANTSKNSCLC